LDLAHAIEYAVEMGSCIVNISPVGEIGESAVQRAIQYAAARNVLVVCSAPDASSPVALADDDRVPNQINVLSIGEQWQPMASCARQSAHLAAPGFARVPQWRGSGHSTLLGNAIGAAYVSGCAALIKTLNPATGEMKTFASGFYEPGGLSIANGTLFVADTNNHEIRTVDLRTRQVARLPIAGLTPPASFSYLRPQKRSTD
jgi:streptogramin lyase